MAAQIPDTIFIQGEKLELCCDPLELYWVFKKKNRPPFLKSPSCKRGYIATWEIIDKTLYLRDIHAHVRKRFMFWKSVIRYTMAMLFPESNATGMKAVWFSGKIRIPVGKRVSTVQYDYDSYFERELLITINRGIVTNAVILDYAERELIEA